MRHTLRHTLRQTLRHTARVSTLRLRLPVLAAALATLAALRPAAAQITVYENDDFGGRQRHHAGRIGNLTNRGFNDRASSVVVSASSGRSATTPTSAAAAACCAPGSTRRWARWA